MLQLKKYPYSGILGWSTSRYDKFKTVNILDYYKWSCKKKN
jgi:hypothetical protein